MTRKFASIKHPNAIAYEFDSEAYIYSGLDSSVCSKMRYFETYGDGLCQHSGSSAITRERLADYLASITQYILAENDWELAGRLAGYLIQPDQAKIAFAYSVRFNPESDSDYGKNRYYSVDLQKIAKRKVAEHDRRYESISSSEDGSPESVYRLIVPSYANDLQRLLYADAVRNWFSAQSGAAQRYCDMPAQFLKWHDDRHDAQTLYYALNAAICVVKLANLRDQAECNLRNCRNALAPPAAEPVEDSAAA